MERIDTAGSCLRMTRTIVPIAIAVAVAMVIGPPMAPPVVRSATSRTRLVALHTRVLTSAMATSPLVAPVAGPISVSALAQGAWTILRSSRGGTVPVKVPLLRAGAPAVAHAVAVPMAVVPPAIIAPRLCTRIAICALALADRPSTRGVGAIASGAGPTRRGRRRTTAGILPSCGRHNWSSPRQAFALSSSCWASGLWLHQSISDVHSPLPPLSPQESTRQWGSWPRKRQAKPLCPPCGSACGAG
eukprot:CAMPEP_0180703742 /NCGR_PEP_ID=MMETSP1038_2-20121128/6791_1 /TAXON_ID=632150 /ORGANISM="Azadinium spinosum, Strain 3D9" /LENGTH=244 /DNA_ID=CAMNT_0022735541 /DNA_START=83 /DNA_END=814 /DNA_ORIENTATION=-